MADSVNFVDPELKSVVESQVWRDILDQEWTQFFVDITRWYSNLTDIMQ